MLDGHIRRRTMADIKELIPDPAVLITGLRDTGYDFNTSLADIVDNSIDAEASSVDIRIELRPNGEPLVTVADDGCGMSLDELIDGMRYGSSDTAKKNPKRLGKFGLGLKTASTAYCKKLSVISKSKKEDPFVMATWDLDRVARDNKWQLELFKEEDIPSYFLNRIRSFANEGHGTLVIWEKIDRMSTGGGRVTKNTIDRYATEFNKYATMIYHRFLGKDDKRAPYIPMTINGTSLVPFDPFCIQEIRENDDSGTLLYLSDEKDCTVQMTDGASHTAKFILNGYVLPYKDDFSTDNARIAARITNKNMGFWVYRENRLIAAGDWLGTREREPHDSLCRIEFSFDHDLDAAFKIDIKKSTITLSPDLQDWLRDWSTPIQQFANKRYRGNERKKIASSEEINHKEADNSIQRNEEGLSLAKVVVDDTKPTTNGTAIVNVKNASNVGEAPLSIRIIVPETKDKGVTVIPRENLDDGVLWTPTINNNHHSVMINSTHPFYQKVYYPNRNNRDVISALDYMLWALSETEWGLQTTGLKDHFQDFKINVSRILKSLVNELPDPEV